MNFMKVKNLLIIKNYYLIKQSNYFDQFKIDNN
jgi:hypothetical protein